MLRQLSILSALALASPLVTATRAEAARPGDWELTLSGSGVSDQDGNGGTVGAAGSFGYFVDEHWQLSLRQSLGYTDLTDNFSGSTRLGFDYHFHLGEWQPFLGASLGYTYGGEFADTWGAGPEAGVKYFVNDTTFIHASVGYDFFFRKADNLAGDFRNGQFIYGIGIGFRF